MEREMLQNEECSNCGTNGLESQLYMSVFYFTYVS